MSAHILVCPNCHEDDVEVLPADTYEVVALCNLCGFGRGTSREHLLAS